MTRLTANTLRAGLDELAGRDADVARALRDAGYPALRRRAAGFGTLLKVICDQQLSTASAAAIWRRLEAAVSPLTPERFLAMDDGVLRAAGLSRQKIRYGRHLAEGVASGAVRLDRLGRMDDEEAVAELVAIKGIGRWTAEIYLLFALGRRDVWPADDLALIVAAQRLKAMPDRPGRPEMEAIADAWRPWRGAAAHLLWHYYRAVAK